MILEANQVIALINLFSLVLGSITIGMIFRLSKIANTPFLNYYFYFLICAVISGFCDWIIFNWLLLLVPGISATTIDIIFHIFWDLIGFPMAIFAIYFLIRTLNSLLEIKFKAQTNRIIVGTLFVVTLLSFVSLYYQLQDEQVLLKPLLWYVFIYVIPITNLSYLIFAVYRSKKMKSSPLVKRRFISLIFFSFLFWYIFSLEAIQVGLWHRLLILSFYLALFVPAFYLFKKYRHPNLPKELNESMEDLFSRYNFTSREKELTMLIVSGNSNQEISDQLFISLQTVKNYISKMYLKSESKNRIQFINFIRQHQEKNYY